MLYLKTQSVPRCKHFSCQLKNQSVFDVSGTSRSLFSDKYVQNTQTQCGQSVQLLNVKPVGASREQ